MFAMHRRALQRSCFRAWVMCLRAQQEAAAVALHRRELARASGANQAGGGKRKRSRNGGEQTVRSMQGEEDEDGEALEGDRVAARVELHHGLAGVELAEDDVVLGALGRGEHLRQQRAVATGLARLAPPARRVLDRALQVDPRGPRGGGGSLPGFKLIRIAFSIS